MLLDFFIISNTTGVSDWSQQNDSFFKTFKQYLYIMGLSRYSYLIKPNGKTQRLVHVRAV